MTERWARPVARIRRGNDVVGAGMLAPGGVVLTCAHVIEDALCGTGATAGPGAKVTLDLPFSGLRNIAATVAKDGWHPAIPEAERGADCAPSDLAVLDFAVPGRVVVPEACLIGETDAAPGALFSAQGFPLGYPSGALAEGSLRGPDAGGWLDAMAGSAFGHFVDPGFSGAPVFAGQGPAVVAGTALGMCVTNDADNKRIARLIPPAHLAQVLRMVISPYRWLAAFEDRDAPFYFGREALTESLWQELRQRRFLLFAGASGNGKSSVLRAGLANRAARAGYAVRIFRPLADARAELAAALGLPRETTMAAVADAVRHEAGKQPLLLGVDQAEELVRGAQAEPAGDLLRIFAELREELEDRLLLVLAARGDALDALFAVQPRLGGRAAAGLLERHLRFLDPLGREGLHDAIVRPAARLRVRVAPRLADKIVEDVLRDQVPLPVVELCLSRLWQSVRGDEIPAAAYDEMGGVTGALARHASDVLAEIGRKAEAFANTKSTFRITDLSKIRGELEAQTRAILMDLVQVGSSYREDRRRREPISKLPKLRGELFDLSETAADSIACQELEAGRLVVAVRLPDGSEALELAHDSLLTEWKELREWIDADRSFRRWHDRLIARVQDTPDDLLSGAALMEAERVLQGEGAALLDPSVKDFVERSRAAEQTRATTEAARLQAERDAALRMNSLFLADRTVQATAQGDPMTGMLLALEALPDPTTGHQRPLVSEAVFALYQAWARNRERACLMSDRPVRHAVFSPDDTRIVTASDDKTARLWDAITSAPSAICLGHRRGVVYAAFSRDGTRIVTASDDATARLWDAATGVPLATCEGHQGGVVHAAFSPDGMYIVTASDDATARLWDATAGTPVATCVGHLGPVGHAAFSPDGMRIVTASVDKTTRVWDATTGAPLATCEGHQGGVMHAAFSPNGTRIVTASIDKTTRVWDAATGALLATCEGHQGRVGHAAFSPDGMRIITACDDKTARLWDAATGAPVANCEGHRSGVVHVAFSPDGTRIVTAGTDKTARLWDAATGASVATCEGHRDGVWYAAFSPDGTQIVTASSDNTARVWGAATGAPLATCEGHQREVGHAAFSPDGTGIVTASDDKTARLWDAATAAPLGTCEGHQDRVGHAAFSPDGTRIVTASDDKTARLWDAATGAPLGTCEGHQDRVGHSAFSPDGTCIVTASDDATARVWDAATGAALATCEGHRGPVVHAAFSPDGMRIVTASDDKTVRVWDAVTGAPVATCAGHRGPVGHAAFSPDGMRIVTACDDKTARLWDAETGAPVATCEGHQGGVMHAAFSPDGTRIVTASRDKTARVWDAETGAPLATCEGHQHVVWRATFSPDGTRIVTAGTDKTARLWDAASGAPLATFEGHRDGVWNAAFSPDGTQIVTASHDTTARVWRCFRTAAELVAFVSPLLTRGLTARQRQDNHLLPLPGTSDNPDAIPPPRSRTAQIHAQK